jgi:hypothetical protein
VVLEVLDVVEGVLLVVELVVEDEVDEVVDVEVDEVEDEVEDTVEVEVVVEVVVVMIVVLDHTNVVEADFTGPKAPQVALMTNFPVTQEGEPPATKAYLYRPVVPLTGAFSAAKSVPFGLNTRSVTAVLGPGGGET